MLLSPLGGLSLTQVKDVVKAVLEAVNNPDSPGQTYEIVG